MKTSNQRHALQLPKHSSERIRRQLEPGNTLLLESLPQPKGDTYTLFQWKAHAGGGTLKTRASETIQYREAEVIKHKVLKETITDTTSSETECRLAAGIRKIGNGKQGGWIFM